MDAGAIADGSVAQAIEGRHYARSVCLHKQSFEVQLRKRMQSEDIKPGQTVREGNSKLRHLCAENLQLLLDKPTFKELHHCFRQMVPMVEYLNDVSAMLCLIAAVREKVLSYIWLQRGTCFPSVSPSDIKTNRKVVWEDL